MRPGARPQPSSRSTNSNVPGSNCLQRIVILPTAGLEIINRSATDSIPWLTALRTSCTAIWRNSLDIFAGSVSKASSSARRRTCLFWEAAMRSAMVVTPSRNLLPVFCSADAPVPPAKVAIRSAMFCTWVSRAYRPSRCTASLTMWSPRGLPCSRSVTSSFSKS